MSARQLGIAADVLRSFGSAFGGRHLALIGGIVPSLIVDEPPQGMEPHVGTSDLDLHLSLHLIDGDTAEYYDSIIDGLRSLGLGPDRDSKRVIKWRWIGRYRDIRVQVELMCPIRSRGGRPEKPAAGTPAEVNIGPDHQITAHAVGFGHLVLDDTVVVRRRVETSSGGVTFPFPVAGLASWLCLKSDAIVGRDKPKDAYDVVWALDALGSEAAVDLVAASPLLTGEPAGEVATQLDLLIHDQFRDAGSVGPGSYATFFDADPGERERLHAYGTLAAFGRALSERGVLGS